MSAPEGPSADVSVRVAWADDADAIAQLQLRDWQQRYADVLPAEVFDIDAMRQQWQQSLTQSPDARNRVMIALERNAVRGFAVTMPAEDPDTDPVADAELAEFVVDADFLGHGHGSRLMQAVAETMVGDRFHRALTWINSTSDEWRGFLTGAGWAPDGGHRALDLDGTGTTTVKQIRLHTSLDALAS